MGVMINIQNRYNNSWTRYLTGFYTSFILQDNWDDEDDEEQRAQSVSSSSAPVAKKKTKKQIIAEKQVTILLVDIKGEWVVTWWGVWVFVVAIECWEKEA